jgi:hypothetical protein
MVETSAIDAIGLPDGRSSGGGRPVGAERPVGIRALRSFSDLISRLNRSTDLSRTLQAAVDGGVSGLGFGAAVVNLVREDSALEVVAAAGRDDLGAALLGRVRRPRAPVRWSSSRRLGRPVSGSCSAWRASRRSWCLRSVMSRTWATMRKGVPSAARMTEALTAAQPSLPRL